jgi:hypothetical protein
MLALVGTVISRSPSGNVLLRDGDRILGTHRLEAGVIEIHAEVAGQLGQPRSGGVGGDAEDVDAAGGVLDDDGLIAQTRRRTVCGMLIGAGLDRVWHHSRAHRLFAVAR